MVKIRKHHLFVYALISGLLLIFPITSAMSDQRLTQFLQKFETLQNKHLPLDHPDNPFHGRTSPPFETGLDAKKHATFINAQTKGDCFLVDQLIVEGFLNLYPFLEPAFKNEKTGGKLIFMLNHGYQSPATRCFAHKFINDLKKRRALKEFSPLNMGLEVDQKHERVKRSEPETDRDILISSQFRLGKTAFCSDYPLSIKDVITTANKPGGMILSLEEKLYLIERAHLHGLYSDQEHNQLIKNMPSTAPLTQLRHQSRHNRITQMQKVKGFWQQTCKTVHNMAKEREKNNDHR